MQQALLGGGSKKSDKSLPDRDLFSPTATFFPMGKQNRGGRFSLKVRGPEGIMGGSELKADSHAPCHALQLHNYILYMP